MPIRLIQVNWYFLMDAQRIVTVAKQGEVVVARVGWVISYLKLAINKIKTDWYRALLRHWETMGYAALHPSYALRFHHNNYQIGGCPAMG